MSEVYYRTMQTSPAAKPFLKWPGGKRWLVNEIAPILRENLGPSGTYFEPFLGGGAMFFALAPKRAVLSDINGELINAYRVVARSASRVEKALRSLVVSSDEYYKIRSTVGGRAFDRAVRFIYLNRTAFGGIYRLNQFGEFNVPYGGRSLDVLWRDHLIANASRVLRDMKIETSDYAHIFDRAGRGDVIFADPTYTVAHDNNGFVRYNERNFSWRDQEQLAILARRAAARGVCVVITNAAHSAVRDLYPTAEIRTVARHSCVARSSESRRRVDEFVIALPKRVLRSSSIPRK